MPKYINFRKSIFVFVPPKFSYNIKDSSRRFKAIIILGEVQVINKLQNILYCTKYIYNKEYTQNENI